MKIAEILKNDIKKIKFSIFWELIVFTLIIILVNIVFYPNDFGFHKIILNPFLLLILFAAMRYGMKWGLTAFLISALYYLFTPPYSLTDMLLRTPQIALFLALIIIFGPIQARYAKKISDLEGDIQKLRNKFKDANENLEVTTFLKNNYESQILTQTTTMLDLFRDATRMQVLEVDAIYKEALAILKNYVNAEKCSIYIYDKNDLQLKSSLGFKDYDRAPLNKIDFNTPPYKVVLEQKKVLSINEDQFKKTITSDMPVYVGPLKNDEDEILGLMVINNISLLNFNRVSKNIFTLLCEWVSRAIENAEAFKLSEKRRILNPQTKIFKFNYFLMRLEEAFLDAKRSENRYLFIIVDVRDWEKVLPEHKTAVLKFVSRIILQSIRDFDVLAHYDRENEFAVLMKNASSYLFDNFKADMEKHLDLYNLRPYGNDKVMRLAYKQVLSFNKMDSVEEVLKEIRKV